MGGPGSGPQKGGSSPESAAASATARDASAKAKKSGKSRDHLKAAEAHITAVDRADSDTVSAHHYKMFELHAKAAGKDQEWIDNQTEIGGDN